MEVLWNKLHLERPPMNTWRVFKPDFGVSKFLATVRKIEQDITSQDILHTEAAILSRLIYRMKSKFRSDKGLKNMEKVNRALLNYLVLDLAKEYKRLKDNIANDHDIVILPTRQMLEYVLVRTQGCAKLMCRIEDVTMNAAKFLKARISLGQAWAVSVIAYSVISRIWVLSRYLVKRCCNWYDDLYHYLKAFEIVGVPWLPHDYVLPYNLKAWLDVSWIDEELNCIPTHHQQTETIFNLIKVGHNEMEDLKFAVELKTNGPEDNVPKLDLLRAEHETNENRCNILQTDDIGQPVSRQGFKLDSTAEKTNDKTLLNKSSEDPSSSKDTSKSKFCSLPVSCKRKKEECTSSCKATRRKKFCETVEEKTTAVVKEKERLQTISTTNEKEKRTTDVQAHKEKMLKNLKSVDDFNNFFSADSYPGLDKLQWNMLKRKTLKSLNKLSKHDLTDKAKLKLMRERLGQRLRDWTN
ncbi:uncharacterized protein LOC105694767 [Orussus abietinus]|uniref:uncharacterized protein LOC105694767 n=1 Tax=Orussus abietinus TaxID=222816 RepID=UPI000625C761|nr:uncharacterized protein LOC105694767 [Orussus abietinus]XP_012271140.1 uncharacterized protein LOC105694767 [Orussus abietinus]